MKVFSYIRRGHGRSRNARDAESEGRFPLSRATPLLRDRLKANGVKATLAKCKAALEATWDGEWHHTGKFGLRTNYYCLAAAERVLLSQKIGGAA
jgi:hypothetical protein